ncbi:Replication factor C small subunit, partial [Candidatus Woesearchaeota archaeon]|nr:Replication factor C small subunit [Candidatus Woesearchaeota archaeon]
SQETVFEIASMARPEEVRLVLEECLKGNFAEAKKALLDALLNHGLSGMDVIKQIQSEVWKMDADDRLKLFMTKACGECEFRMVEGSDEFVQLEALLANIILLADEKNE